MLLGAIQISQRTTRLRVTEVSGTDSRRLLDRPHRVSAVPRNLDRLTALLMSEVEAARGEGAERIEVTAAPELRGTRLLRQLERVSTAIGSGRIAVPGRSETLSAAFLAVTVPGGESEHSHDPEGQVAVALVEESFLGLATGHPGRRPTWVGSRPLGTAALTSRARFSDPPRPNQIEAAINGAVRAVGSLAPPRCGSVFVASTFAPVLERLCGSRIGEDSARRGLDSILGQTAEDTAAWFGAEPATARHLPAAIVACLALAGRLEADLMPASFDPVAGRWWLTQAGDTSMTRGRAA